MRIRTALGHLSRVLHGSCDASRSKEGHRVVGVAVFNRARVRCANAFGEFGISQLFRANTYYRMPCNTVRNLTYQDHLYFPTNSRFFTTSTYGTVLTCTILRLVVVGRAQLRHSGPQQGKTHLHPGAGFTHHQHPAQVRALATSILGGMARSASRCTGVRESRRPRARASPPPRVAGHLQRDGAVAASSALDREPRPNCRVLLGPRAVPHALAGVAPGGAAVFRQGRVVAEAIVRRRR